MLVTVGMPEQEETHCDEGGRPYLFHIHHGRIPVRMYHVARLFILFEIEHRSLRSRGESTVYHHQPLNY
jgi:hypothetical protein